MGWFLQLLAGVAINVLAYVLQPKPKQPKPLSVDDLEDPTAEAGRPIPVVFGTIKIQSGNNIGDWDKAIRHRSAGGGKK